MKCLFRENEKWEEFFLRTVLFFGIIMCVITPIMEVQDEDTHTMRSINMSYFNFDYKQGFDIYQSVYTFINAYTEDNGIYVFEDNPEYRINHDIYWKSMSIPLNEDEKVFFRDGSERRLRTYLYGNIAYFPQGLGIFIGRLFDLPIFYTLLMGRLFKLFFYAAVCFWAIKLIPVKKNMMAFLCVMPMPVFFAASLSPEGILVSCCYLFIAYVLYCREKYKKIPMKSIPIILGLLIIIYSVKRIYVMIAILLLLFVDFKELYVKNKKRVKIIVSALLLICVLGGIGLYNTSQLVKEYINNFPVLVFLFFKTYIINFGYYLKLGMANFGTGINMMNSIYIYISVGYIIILALQKDSLELVVLNERMEKRKRDSLFFISFCIISALIFLGACSWMTSSLTTQTLVEGIQGRYFIPIIPLILLLFYNRKINIKYITNMYVQKVVSIVLLTVSCVYILHRYW